MFALIASIGNLYAATVTFDATKDKSSTMTLTKDGVTLSLSKGDGSSVGKLGNGTDYRPYAKNTLTISSEYTITKIVFTCTKDGKTKGGPGNFNVTNGGGLISIKEKLELGQDLRHQSLFMQTHKYKQQQLKSLTIL